MSKRSKRGNIYIIFRLFYIFVLVGGLVAGTVLVRRNQKLDRRAQSIITLTNASWWQYITVKYNSSCSSSDKPAPDNYQAVHPSVLYFPEGWKGYKFWMSVSPFPNNDARCEHPHIFASNTGRWKNWEQPIGNPVVPDVDSSSYEYSDADLVMVGDTMYMFYRRNAKNGTSTYDDDDTVLFRTFLCPTCNSWSNPQAIRFVSVPGDQNVDEYKVKPSGLFASPAILYENNVWRMYYVDTINRKVRYAYSNDGINFNYMKDISVNYYPKDPWHIDVFKYQSRYFMLLNQRRTVSNPSLYLLTNDNTSNWTNKGPILSPSSNSNAWDKSAIYRASAVVVDNQLMLWYSGFTLNNVHTGLIIDPTWGNWWYR